jgi:hypothetical protein
MARPKISAARFIPRFEGFEKKDAATLRRWAGILENAAR